MLKLRPSRLVLVFAVAALFSPLSGSAAAAGADAPANDAFAQATRLVDRFGVVAGSTVEATREPFERAHGGHINGASVWYEWTAPNHAAVQLSTCGSSFDTFLVVYTGTELSTLLEVGESDNGCGTSSLVAFVATAGTTYRIAVDGANGAKGDFSLQWEHGSTNDYFGDAVELSGENSGQYGIDGDNVLASSEPGEPAHGGPGTRSVWYRWTAPTSGPVVFDTCSADFDTLLAAYVGTAVNTLALLHSNDDFCAGTGSQIGFDARAGETYRIAVDGYNGETGEFVLRWLRMPFPPRNRALPLISGLTRDGETLTGSDGEWDGHPLGFTYTWLSCDATAVFCEYRLRGGPRTYQVTPIDIGRRIRFVVTAVNQSTYPVTVSSAPSAPIQALAPTNLSPPSVSGQARHGGELIADPGTWSGTPPIDHQYQWQRCDGSGTACVDIPGATAAVVDLGAADAGRRLRVVVTATSPHGTASAASAATGVVRAAARQAARRCVVPNVRGKPLAAAGRAIRRAGCGVGRVRRVSSRSVRNGRVVSQSPRPGTRRTRGAKVRLDVSKGRRP